jgi:hypothetical protein
MLDFNTLTNTNNYSRDDYTGVTVIDLIIWVITSLTTIDESIMALDIGHVLYNGQIIYHFARED